MGFYAFFPSNACPDLYPDNTTSHFKIQLRNRLELTGDWQVALMQVHYPNTIAQVTDGENEITFVKEDGSKEIFQVKPGYYTGTADFLFALHEALTPIETGPNGEGRESVVEVTPDQHIMFYAMQNRPYAKYTFSPRLAMMLGLEHPGPYPAQKELCAPMQINLNLGIPPLQFIYMDKITEQIVGDCHAPLLATIPTNTTGPYGGVSVHTFEHPLYFDLVTKSFDTLEVNIRDHTGKFVSFNHGTSMLLCHFRPTGEKQ